MFIGNLSFQSTEEEVREVLAAVDPNVRVRLGKDRMTGKPRGFAFAEFSDATLATLAIARFNGADLRGRPLRMNDADNKPAPRGPRPSPQGFGDRPSGSGAPSPRFDPTPSIFGGGGETAFIPDGKTGGHRRMRGGKRTLR